MKRIQIGIMALAAIAGATSAFTTAPRKSFAPHFFVKQGSGVAFSYTTSAPGSPLSCTNNTNTVCEISTTIAINDLSQSAFPAENTNPGPGQRYVRYVGTADRLYK